MERELISNRTIHTHQDAVPPTGRIVREIDAQNQTTSKSSFFKKKQVVLSKAKTDFSITWKRDEQQLLVKHLTRIINTTTGIESYVDLDQKSQTQDLAAALMVNNMWNCREAC